MWHGHPGGVSLAVEWDSWLGRELGEIEAATDLRESSAMIVVDTALRVVDAAGRALTARGHRPQEWLGRRLEDLLGADAWSELKPRLGPALGGELQSFQYRVRDGGATYWVQIAPIRTSVEAVGSVVITVHDISERLRATEELERSDARLRESERMIGVGSWELGLEDRSITYSAGFGRVVGLRRGESLSVAEYEAMVHREDRSVLADALKACLHDGSASCEYRIIRRDGIERRLAVHGETVLDGDGRVGFVRGAVLDVTEQRASERQRLAAMALFEQAFDAAPIGMALLTPEGRYIRVNDAMCSLLGRSRNELMRLGVDDVTHPDDRLADQTARQAMHENDAADYHGQKRYMRSDGTIVWAAVHVGPVRGADGTIEAFFAQKIDITEAKDREAQLAKHVRDAEWLGRIRDALDSDRLVLYWQPIVDLRTGETIQRELLLRMRGENGAIIAPGEFLAVAERYRLVSEIDRWVIRQAVGLAADGPVQFNLSAASIGDPDVLRELAVAIERTGVDPSLLVVEVTETAMMEQGEAGPAFAEALRALGCALAIDDFGTGFASLSYLRNLHAQQLKIDIEFIRDLAQNENDERLVRGIVGLAREFEQTTTAEGIEDEQTLAKLRELGVHRGQGYLFARPCPVDNSQPPDPVLASSAAGCKDPIAIVRALFGAFADRDLVRAQQLCHPELVLRPMATSRRADRPGAYRGREGLDQYFRDVEDVWDQLRLVPTAFWQANGSIIVFGQVIARVDGMTRKADTLWVYRLRDGMIASVDVFRQPDLQKAPITAG